MTLGVTDCEKIWNFCGKDFSTLSFKKVIYSNQKKRGCLVNAKFGNNVILHTKFCTRKNAERLREAFKTRNC